MILLHPEMYSVAAKGHFPNELNGGTRNIAEDVYMRVFKKDYYEQVGQFEDKIIEVEGAIYKSSFKQSFRALTQFMENNEDLQKLYGNGGIKNLSDERLENLSGQQRRFFRAYFNKLNENATTAYLRDFASKNNISLNPEASPEEIKTQVAPLAENINFSDDDGARYVEKTITPALFQSALEESSRNLGVSPAAEALKLKLVNNLDPANNSAVRRNAVVDKQLKNPQAVARAVRAMIASNLVDKPLELLFTFVCLAGVTSGVMAPLQNEMFGPNSWFYLSRMVFAAGFVYDVISGVLAGTWLKLQTDEFHEGQFNQIPTGEDANKGFFKWFMKQSFDNDQNTLWQNHKNNVKIIWGNMKPAFTMAMIIGLLTMGRLDVDSYLVGYMLSYSVPLSSFFMKLEQGFELASSYFYKDIPEDLRTHPTVQKYVNAEVSKKRLWFNFVEKFYTNTLGFMLGTFSQMSTVEFGSRSLSRIIFAGYTPTELVVKAFEKTKELTHFIPGSKEALTWCENLLSKNYTDFKKIPRPTGIKMK